MEIKELDLTVDGVEEALERTNEIFSGILEVIEELETELESLKNEQHELETDTSYTASKLKRRAAIGSELQAIATGLAEAKKEHQSIADAHSNELRSLEAELQSKYNGKLRAATRELREQAVEKAKEAEMLVGQVNKIMHEGKDTFIWTVSHKINDATGIKGHKKIISPYYVKPTVTLEDLKKARAVH